MKQNEKDIIIAAQNRLEFEPELGDIKAVLEYSKNIFEHKCSQILVYDPVRMKVAVIINNGYSEEFLDIFIRFGYYKIDPVFIRMCLAERLFHWYSAVAGYFRSEETLKLKNIAESYGIVDGFTYTKKFSRYLVMLSFVCDDYIVEADKAKVVLFSHCHNYLNSAQKYLRETIRGFYNIADEEYKAFELYTKYHDYSLVASELGGKSKNTVRNQIQDVRIKLGAKTLDEALCIAFREGLVE